MELGISPTRNRFREPLDALNTWVLNGAARDPSDRVVMDAGITGDESPVSKSFEGLKRLDNFFELHNRILGMRALAVKADLHKAFVHHSSMPAKNGWPEPTTAFQANLQRLIGDESVNAWANKHKLDQTTIQRLVSGQDPKLSTIETIAGKLGLQPWHLLVANLRADADRNPPIIQGGGGETEVNLWKRIDELMDTVTKLKATVRGMSQWGGLEGEDEETGS